MGKKIKILRKQSKILILVEAALIFLFLLFTLFEIGVTIEMKSYYESNIDNYFLYVMERLMLSSGFFANYYLQGEIDKDCPDGYKKNNYLVLKTLKSVYYENVTNNIQVTNVPNKPINNTFMGNKYYDIDLAKNGNSSINFLYEYQFNKFGGYYFCLMNFYMDQSKRALNIISPSRSCKLTFPKYDTADCGLYNNGTYRMCLLKNFLYFDNGTKVLEKLSNTSDNFWCPYNMLKISIKNNSLYNSSDPNSKESILDIEETLRNEGKDKEAIDKSFFFNFSPIPIIGRPYNFTNPNNDFIYSDENTAKTYDRTQPYGFKSAFSNIIYTTNFYRFYHLNFKIPSDNYTFINGQKISTPLTGEDGKSFYFINDTSKNNTIQINFLTDIFPTISKECFRNIFEANNILSFTNFFFGLGTAFFFESSAIINSWFIAKLFLSVWYYGKIRLYTLYEKYKIKLSLPDQKFESTTFYTGKALGAGIYIILLTTLHFNGSSFSYIITWTKQIIDEKCFNIEITENIQYYYKFISELNNKNNIIITFIWLSVVLEIAQIAVYIYYRITDNEPLTVENKTDNES